MNSTLLYNCSIGSFAQVCARFLGELNLVFLQGTGTPVPPQMGTFLTELNLGSLVDVATLVVTVGNAFGSVTQNLSPSFLTQLQFVRQSLTITDQTPNTPRLVSLPGLTSLRQVGGDMVVTGTALANMASFAALECVTRGVTLGGNSALTSLAGLERLSSVGASLGTVAVFNTTGASVATPLTGPAALVPLTVAARCAGPTSPLTQLVSIKVTECASAFTTWPRVCAYIATGVC